MRPPPHLRLPVCLFVCHSSENYSMSICLCVTIINMKTLREAVAEAREKKVAIGHFNISNLEALWGIFRAAQGLNVPVIIGVSEGERDFVGVKQAAALVKSIR